MPAGSTKPALRRWQGAREVALPAYPGVLAESLTNPGERTRMTDQAGRGSAAHFYNAAGPHQMFAPLIGVP